VDAVAIAAALGLAFVLGISDAPNASAALVVSRAAGWRSALTFSFVFHAIGALAGGTAVAVTISSLVHARSGVLPSVYAAAALAAVGFVTVAAHRGVPASDRLAWPVPSSASSSRPCSGLSAALSCGVR
jgi:phosphate/sulfate permease